MCFQKCQIEKSNGDGLVINLDISVVIITHNNYSLKEGCIETVVFSLINQKEVNFEIIIVDNYSDKDDWKKLSLFVRNINCDYDISLLRNEYNNISKGRNIGIKNAKYSLIVFMDDDILLPQKDILKKISLIYDGNNYGYSAIRSWTPANWYAQNKIAINNNFKSNCEEYKLQMDNPNPAIRKKNNNRHLIRTYIGNFGFCSKTILEKVGYWDESYCGYGVEDDTMALLLYLNFGRPVLLTDISVVHIWHKISNDNYTELEHNRIKFNELLKKLGVSSFHVGRLLYDEDNVIEFL